MGCPEILFSMTSVNAAIHIHVILENARLVHLWLLRKIRHVRLRNLKSSLSYTENPCILLFTPFFLYFQGKLPGRMPFTRCASVNSYVRPVIFIFQRGFFFQTKKLVRKENTTFKHCRPTQGTARKSQRTQTATRHTRLTIYKEYNLLKQPALFPIKMIEKKLESTLSTA